MALPAIPYNRNTKPAVVLFSDNIYCDDEDDDDFADPMPIAVDPDEC